MYKRNELINLHQQYLELKQHNWKPYTKTWLSLLLDKWLTIEEIAKRDRLSQPTKRVDKRLSEWEKKIAINLLEKGYKTYQIAKLHPSISHHLLLKEWIIKKKIKN